MRGDCRVREGEMISVLASWAPKLLDAFIRIAKFLTT
jgi:hypothetical protein